MKVITMGGLIEVRSTDISGTNSVLCVHRNQDFKREWNLSHNPTGYSIAARFETRTEAKCFGEWLWSQLPKRSKIAFESADKNIVINAFPQKLRRRIIKRRKK